MKRTTQAVATVGLAVGLAIGGAGVAQAALVWGTLSVSDSSGLQGQGYGKAYHSGSTAKLSSTLRDVNKGHGRTFASAVGYGKAPDFQIQSGRRADGGRAFAPMALRSKKLPASVDGYRVAVKICQDVPASVDTCSAVKYGWF